jgi:hypothetical protein
LNLGEITPKERDLTEGYEMVNPGHKKIWVFCVYIFEHTFIIGFSEAKDAFHDTNIENTF